ncbi:MAG: ribonuclease HII [Crocinitomicaceae bacterium]|jgi:ribonuclease HII|tara:strand:+ start:3402 stop:4016 length:615 start_codon:yes stop_codon:yes gene_type:complete
MSALQAFCNKNVVEAGCDEAGRGCLSGPVVAGAVVLNPDNPIKGLNDSKKLSEKNRLLLRDEILNKALDYGVGIVSNIEIDEINILNASFLAMHRAVDQLKKIKPQHLLIDGNRFNKYESLPHSCIIKGDGIYQSIAAASILAKTTRDQIMRDAHDQYPIYDWCNNKGYPTKNHRKAIAEFGTSPHHRMSFNLLGNDWQLRLFK